MPGKKYRFAAGAGGGAENARGSSGPLPQASRLLTTDEANGVSPGEREARMNHLNEDEIATLGALLDERERTLKSGVHEHVSRLMEGGQSGTGSAPGDAADQAEVVLARDHESTLVARDVRELRDIAAARTRIAEGEAGICVDCGVEIPFARLAAQPTAARCVPCQSIYERTHAAAPETTPPREE